MVGAETKSMGAHGKARRITLLSLYIKNILAISIPRRGPVRAAWLFGPADLPHGGGGGGGEAGGENADAGGGGLNGSLGERAGYRGGGRPREPGWGGGGGGGKFMLRGPPRGWFFRCPCQKNAAFTRKGRPAKSGERQRRTL